MPLLLLPVLGLLLLYFAWSRISGDFMLLEARSAIEGARSMFYAALGIVLAGSAVLVGIDASRYGFGRKGAEGSLRTGPAGWAIGQLLLWLVAFPWYIAARRKASHKAISLTAPAILLAQLVAGNHQVRAGGSKLVGQVVAEYGLRFPIQLQAAGLEIEHRDDGLVGAG